MEDKINADAPDRKLPAMGADDSHPKLQSLSNDIDHIYRKLGDFENSQVFVLHARPSPANAWRKHKAIRTLLGKAGKKFVKISKKDDISPPMISELKRLEDRMITIQARVDATRPSSVFHLCLGPSLALGMMVPMWCRGFSWGKRE